MAHTVRNGFLIIMTVLNLAAQVISLPLPDFFPFGTNFGDQTLPPGNGESATLALQQAFPFYGKSRENITVHTDGFLNLIDVPGPGHQSSSFASIYVFAADVDTSSLGQVFYRESSDPLLLESARTIVESLLPAFSATPLTSLFIATWLNVGYFDSNADSANTFQCVLGTEGNISIAFLLYADEMIEWTTGDADGGIGGLGGDPADVGFADDDIDSDRSNSFFIPGSNTSDILNVDTTTNVGLPGAWLFQVDGEKISNPILDECDLDIDNCDQNAACIDLSEGFLCVCRPGFAGDGFFCTLEDDVGSGLSESGSGSASESGLPIEGSCVDAGFTDCCNTSCDITSDNSICFCDQQCFSLNDCCFDILDVPCFPEIEFCNFEIVTATLVQYSWPETIAGDEASLPCALGPNSSLSNMGMARRFCNNVTAEWEEPNLEECLNVIVIGLVNTSLSVNESDGDVVICAEVENVIQVNFTGSFEVTILTTDITAQAGVDFSAISQMFMFDIQYAQVDGEFTGEQQCITVSISNDAVLENDEMVSLFLHSIDPNIHLIPEFANVTIIDDDVAQVRFEETEYVVNETTSVEICIFSFGESERNISIRISFESITAGAGIDFDSTQVVIVFEQDNSPGRECAVITIYNDAILEDKEEFLVKLTSPDPDVIVLDPRIINVAILDNDAIIASLEMTEYAIVEGGSGVLEVCINATGELERSATITLNTSDATAVGDSDYQSVTQAITFQHAQQFQCVNITILDDQTLENAEVFFINLATTDLGIVFYTSSATVTIGNDDAISVIMQEADYTVSEGNGSITVCAILIGDVDRSVKVTLLTESITASVSDFDDTSITLMFSSDITAQCASVGIQDDSSLENNEVFSVELESNDTDVIFTELSSAAVVILDNDRVNVNLEQDTYTIAENEGFISVCVILDVNNEIERNVELLLTAGPITASAGLDFNFTSTGIIFSRNETSRSQCIMIAILNDDILEENQTFSVVLSTNDQDVDISQSQSTVTIANDDDVTVALLQTAFIIGEEQAPINATICSILLALSEREVLVTLSTLNGTAQANTDYVPVTQEIIFQPGVTQQCVGILILSDEILEDVEQFVAILSTNDRDVSLQNNSATVVIESADEVTIGFPVELYTVREENGFVTVCAVLTGQTERNVLVMLSTISRNATAGADFTPQLSVQLQFSQLESQFCVNVSIIDDSILESDEQLEVLLETSEAVVTLNLSTAALSIIDNDNVIASFKQNQYPVSEGNGSVTVCITLNNTIERNITVTVSTQAITAQDTIDFSPLSQDIVFAPTLQQLLQCVSIFVTSDLNLEENETFFAVLTSADSDVIIDPNIATVTILNDDEVTVSLRQTTYGQDEGNGNVLVCADLSGISARDVIVNLSTTDGSAIGIDDYFPTVMELIFRPAVVLQCVNLSIVDDSVLESTEQFSVLLSTSDSGVIFANSSAAVIIFDNDNVTVSLRQLVYEVGEEEGSLTVCVVLFGLTARNVSVFASTTESGDAEAENDFENAAAQLTFSPTTSERCIVIAIVNDTILENDEEFTVQLQTADEAVILDPQSSVVIISNDDGILIMGFEQDTYEVNETENLVTVCVNLTAPIERSVVVTLFTVGTTAQEGIDYIPVSQNLTFDPHENAVQQCTDIFIISDTIYEENEVFSVFLTNNDPDVAIRPESALVTIFDDDGVEIAFQDPVLVIGESDGSVRVCTNLVGQIERNVLVTYTTLNGSAGAGNDYSTMSGELLFQPEVSNQPQCADIPIFNDETLETNEFFLVVLVNESVSVDLSQNVTAVTILDDDMVTVGLQQEEYEVFEGDETETLLLICAELNGQIERDVFVTLFTLEAADALAPDDFLSTNTQLFFQPDGLHVQCVNITIISESILENNESFLANLTTDDPAIILSPSMATLVILNDDMVTVGLQQTLYNVNEEDGSVMVCAELSGSTERDINVSLDAVDETAQALDDFTVTNLLVFMFRQGALESCIYGIFIIDDSFLEDNETFSVVLSAIDPAVSLDPASATVIIVDNEVALTHDLILMELSSLANSEQTLDNLVLIAQLFAQFADSAVNGNITITDQSLENITHEVATLLEWPQDILQQQSARIIQSFEQLIGIVVQQEEFSRLLVRTDFVIIFANQVTEGIPDEILQFSPNAVTRKRRQTFDTPEIMLPQSLYDNISSPIEGSQDNYFIGTPVIGATVAGTEEFENLQESVTILLQLENSTSEVQCVSWNESAADGIGNWTNSGCSTSGPSLAGNVTCSCNLLANFALLVSTEPLVCGQNSRAAGEGFICECLSGYDMLVEDNNSCTDKNECLEQPCDTNATCSNTVGSFECVCREGYTGTGFSCTGIQPNITMTPNSTGVVYESGRELNITCEATNTFGGTVEWMSRGEPVLDIGDVAAASDDAIGRLFIERISQSIVVLRTHAGIGIQPEASGIYTCTARNGIATATSASVSANINVAVPGIQDVSVAYLRFTSVRALEDIQIQELSSEQFILAYISTTILREVDEDLPGIQTVVCTQIDGSLILNEERLECILTNDETADTALNILDTRKFNIESALNTTEIPVAQSSINISANGFCDFSVTENSRGTYMWLETAAEINANVSLECMFDGPGVAIRFCNQTLRQWEDPDLDECYTEVTQGFQEIGSVAIVVTNIVEVVDNLSVLVDIAQSEDQIIQNLVMIVEVFRGTIGVFSNASRSASSNGPTVIIEDIPLDEQREIIEDIVSIVSGLQIWPMPVLEEDASEVIESFEFIASLLVLQENFTNLTDTQQDVALVAERFNIEDLAQIPEGQFARIFSAASSDNSEPVMVSADAETEDLSTDQSALIALPTILFEEINATDVGIFFTFYERPILFPLRGNLTVEVNVTRAIGTTVIGATVAGQILEGLSEPIIIVLRLLDERALNPRCASWDFTATENLGNWTTEGCETEDIGNRIVRCRCNHLTNFACIVDICTRTDNCQPLSEAEQLALNIISIAGVVLSLIGLFLTVVTLLSFTKLRTRDATKFHVQLSIALFFMLLVFIIGIDRVPPEYAYGGCVTVSALIQYFSLVAFMWMGAEALLMFQKLVIVFIQITTKYIIAVSLVCWLVPILPVIIPLAVDRDFMVNRDADNNVTFCFIGDIRVFFGAFLGPMFAILLFNTVIFVIVIATLVKHSKKTLRRKADQGKRKTIIRLMCSIAGVMSLFGLAWVFGALTVITRSFAFQVLFAIFNSLQGFMLFVFFCVISKESRELWMQLLCSRRKPFSSAGTLSKTRKGLKQSMGTSSKSPFSTGVRSRTGSLLPPSSIPVSDSEVSYDIVETNPMAHELSILEEEPEEVEAQQHDEMDTSLSHSSPGQSIESGIIMDEQQSETNRPTAETLLLESDHAMQAQESGVHEERRLVLGGSDEQSGEADGVDNAVSDSNAGGFSEAILDVIINQHVEDD